MPETTTIAAPFSQFIVTSRSLLRPGPRGGPVFCAARAEGVRDGMIPLVTGVLEQLVFRLQIQVHRYFPGSRKDLGVFDNGFVVNGVFVHSSEALDDVQVLALRDRSHTLTRGVGRQVALCVVVGDVDDQGITLPASPRIAVPQANA